MFFFYLFRSNTNTDESTLSIATEEHSGVTMEVATIKSAYSFVVDSDLVSTRSSALKLFYVIGKLINGFIFQVHNHN